MNAQKKGHPFKDGPLLNYLAWIANLGVVPLFLFAAFLLAPALFFLAALLLLVTHVLETILNLLFQIKSDLLIYFKNKFLPIFGSSVKGIILTLCGTILNVNIQAEENFGQHIVSKGEITVISAVSLLKYSVSNKEVIKIKYQPAKKELQVLALKLGHSVISYYDKDKREHKIDFFVISKNLDLKYSEINSIINKMGLSVENTGEQFLISGEIKSAKSYIQLKKFIANSKVVFNLNLSISENIKNEILGHIYKNLFERNLDFINCHFIENNIQCEYPESDKLDEKTLKELSNELGINFNSQIVIKHNNFKVKFKIIQLEQTNGEEMGLGLEQLDTSLNEIMTSPLSKIIGKNEVKLKENHLSMSTLAEPIIYTELRSQNNIQIGSEIPYKSIDKDKNTTNTEWKFAGLKISFQVDQVNNKLKISYKTELTRPSTENEYVSGSKAESVVFLKNSNPTKLFEILIKTDGENLNQLPYLSKVPILGNIFKSKTNSNNYKKITAIIEADNE